jgi:hypothetical protein
MEPFVQFAGFLLHHLMTKAHWATAVDAIRGRVTSGMATLAGLPHAVDNLDRLA